MSPALEAPCPPVIGQPPKRRLRGVWIATVTNIDWPSKSGLAADLQRAELIRLLDECVRMRMNAFFIQVRPAADAFFPSRHAPWSQYLTGVQGRDPGYDPLAFMVEEAHRRNLELHGWFNPYRVSTQAELSNLVADHAARRNPGWTFAYGGKLYFNPGIPAVRQFLIESILEPVRAYDLDGVHFDDYFYPYPVAGRALPDGPTFEQYGSARFPDAGDWRRDNVNLLIRELTEAIRAIKPWVKFGVSPFGVWRNRATDPTGSETRAGVQDYDDLYADTRTWIRNRWIDYIAPQVYWNIGFAAADYAKLVPWWSAEVEGRGVALYIGQSAYKIADDIPAWSNPDEMPSHIELNSHFPQVAGDIYFSMRSLLANPLGVKDRIVSDVYRQPALVPELPRPAPRMPRPVSPSSVAAKRKGRGVAVSWAAAAAGDSAAYYAVYRFAAGKPRGQCDFEDATNLLGTVRRGRGSSPQSFTDATAAPGTGYAYYVSALDRLHRESARSGRREVPA